MEKAYSDCSLSEGNRVPTLETIKGGGGSVRVGTTGRISTLMSRELESSNSAPHTPVSSMHGCIYYRVSISVPSGVTTPKRLKSRASLDEASSSSINNNIIPQITRKTKHYNRKTHQVPMLHSDNISLDGTPSREKPDKRGSYIVEIVDIKCGNPERTWSRPITNRLKKIGFSKLSESIV